MNYKKLLIAIASGASAAIIAIICIILFKKNEKLPEGSKFLNNDLSDMTHDEVKNTVDTKINSIFKSKKIKLEVNNKIYSMNASDIETHFDSNDVFKVAKKKDSDEIPEVRFNEKKLENFVKKLAEKTKILPKKYSFKISGDTLIVTAGTNGKEIDVEDAVAKIEESLKQLNFKVIKTKTKDIKSKATEINLEEIKKSVECKVKDAEFKLVNGRRIYEDEKVGIELDLAKAKAIVTDPTKGVYKIPLKITNPKLTKQQLINSHKNPNTPHQLASFTTNFQTNTSDKHSVNRAKNIAIAAAAINGIVLLPGEEFSFANTAGRSGANLPAVIYNQGKKDIGPGGGICQVSSTLHNAALLANMDITQVKCHSRSAGYVRPGLDATYSAGGPDYRFKNSLKNPVKIIAAANDKSITVALYGIKLPEEEVNIRIESHVTSNTKERKTAVGRQIVSKNGKVIKTRDFHATYAK